MKHFVFQLILHCTYIWWKILFKFMVNIQAPTYYTFQTRITHVKAHHPTLIFGSESFKAYLLWPHATIRWLLITCSRELKITNHLLNSHSIGHIIAEFQFYGHYKHQHEQISIRKCKNTCTWVIQFKSPLQTLLSCLSPLVPSISFQSYTVSPSDSFMGILHKYTCS